MPIGSLIYFGCTHLTDGASTDRRTKYSMSGPRFYSKAEDNIDAGVNKANELEVDAIVEGGDFTDPHSANSVGEENTNTHSGGSYGQAVLQTAEAAFAQANMPRHHVIGNWDMFDFDFQTQQDWFQHIVNGTPATVTLPTETTYATYYTDADGNDITRFYAFDFGEAIGIVLDGTAPSEDVDEYFGDNGYRSNGVNTSIPPKQRAWLTAFLAANTTKPIIVFTHSWLYPWRVKINYQRVFNNKTIVGILEAAPGGNVVAVMQVHHHPRAQVWWRDNADDIIDEYGDPFGAGTLAGPPFLTPNKVYGITFPKIKNGIKYFCCRGQVIGWGDSKTAPTTDGGSPLGDAIPANAYYLVEVDEFTKGKFDVRVTGYGINPVPDSAEPDSYLVF